MKISTRLSLLFSFIASATFIIFGITVYWLVSNQRSNEFKERLEERVDITEKIFLEKEAFSPEEYEKIRSQFLNTLPEETEEVIEIKEEIKPLFKFSYSRETKAEILNNDNLYFEDGNTQGLSKVFKVKGKNYLIIVTATDQAGLQTLSFLSVSVFILILIGIPFIWIGSFMITKKALLPLTQKILHANAISASNLHQRLEVINSEDEIGKLAIAFNNLLDRLELSFDAHKSFISNASHEIRNPLTAIMGEAEVSLSKPRGPAEYAESLKAILSESEMLSSTVNNLLQLSKVTANEEGVLFESVTFNIFMEEVKTSFDFVNPENRIVISVSKNATKPTILANKNLLKSALINLFDNACKFSENQEVKVILEKEDNYIKLIVSDKGQGISKDDIEKIREPFYRGENTFNIKGSGIGLSLTDKIISLHKGKLTIQSELGQGSEVIVLLPLQNV